MKKVISLILCLSLCLGIGSAPLQVNAIENGDNSVIITISAQADGKFFTAPIKLKVEDGISEKYGYSVPAKDHNGKDINSPVFLDAMVALHKVMYGDAFNKDSAAEYLAISDGYLSKAFHNSGSSGFYINNSMLADENGWGYSADMAPIENGDLIAFWIYQDTTYWSDCYTYFNCYEKTVKQGTEFELTAYKTGYDSNWSMVSQPISSNDDVEVVLVNENGGAYENLTDSEGKKIKVGEGGQVSVSFNNIGQYIVSLKGMVDGYAPIVAPVCMINVVEPSSNIDGNEEDYKIPAIIPKDDNDVEMQLDVPTAVVDYLCIGSQYTNNVNYGTKPEGTLSGSVKSLGNFGGYITYYYENPITNNPNNKYGMDFYVIGNSFNESGTSNAEPGQVYISEDGTNWYALAGSEHYEDSAMWDYTITYKKDDFGNTSWIDNKGNKKEDITQTKIEWPTATHYPLNNVANEAEYKFTGILLKSQLGSVAGDGTAGTYASKIKFGYADYYMSNIKDGIVEDVNPYIANPTKANGFDVAWAVDSNGKPIDVQGKKFHYVKIATASNIWAGGLNEKSTEISYVVKTTAQNIAVGKTAKPSSVIISDGNKEKIVSFNQNTDFYEVDLDDMKYVSLKVSGTSYYDNIYINNDRIESGEFSDIIKVTKDEGKLVRIIVQNGEKEPAIYILSLTSNAVKGNTLIEDVKVNSSGIIYNTTTKDGQNYTVTVGNKVDHIKVLPLCETDVICKVNGKAIQEEYPLSVGVNEFTIEASKDGIQNNITLKVTREKASNTPDSKINVNVALYGDSKHSNDIVHIYSKNKNSLVCWIARTEYSVSSDSTVKDVIEKALKKEGLSYKIEGDGYISKINGLAEFDNGPNSGWLYLINGKDPEVSMSEKKVKNGDSIVFYYTDDYTKEKNGEKWSKSKAKVESKEELLENKSTASAQMKNVIQYLQRIVSNPNVSSVGGEWSILALARSGENIPSAYYKNYYTNVAQELENNKGVLHERKYTEYSRIVVAITSIGGNPENVGGYNLLLPLVDYEKVVWQGANGPIWALIALDCGNYNLSENKEAKIQATREMYVDKILKDELKGGGWAISNSQSDCDVDVTAMALVALSKYTDRNDVKAAINRGIKKLSSLQNDKGGFGSGEGETSEATAQVLTAISALGIDVKDSRFVKNGNTLVDNIYKYYREEGGFAHTLGEKGINLMATEQCLYALVAVERCENNQNNLFDMGDALSLYQGTDAIGLMNKHQDVAILPIIHEGKTFNDIQNHENRQAIEALAAREIVNGMNGNNFEPDKTMTRAEFATIIVRALGLPMASGKDFVDVKDGCWYYDFVNSATHYGIVKGVSENMFNPNSTITREEAVVMVARAADLCGMNTEIDNVAVRNILAEYIDYVDTSTWALDSMAFCYYQNISNSSDIEIKPQEFVARGEIANMIYILLGKAQLM